VENKKGSHRRRGLFSLAAACLLIVLPVSPQGRGTAQSDDSVPIGLFSKMNPGSAFPADWEALTFPNIDRWTQYSLVQDKDNGRTVVFAESDRSASGLIRRKRFNPLDYPIIQWDWKIEGVLPNGDVRRKEGDDYPARLYVAFEFDSASADWWQRTRHKAASLVAGKPLPGSALNYIWTTKEPEGLIVSNPFSEEVKMVVVRSGDSKAGSWVRQRRNLVDDYRQAFGRMPPPVIGIAIMSDSDNTGGRVSAYYGDIVLLRN